MMKKLIQITVFVLLSQLFLSPIFAQQKEKRDHEGPRFSVEERLSMIQQTLELDDASFEPVAAIFKAHWQKQDAFRADMKENRKEARQKARKSRKEGMKKHRNMMQALNKELSEYLSEDQLEALKKMRNAHRADRPDRPQREGKNKN